MDEVNEALLAALAKAAAAESTTSPALESRVAQGCKNPALNGRKVTVTQLVRDGPHRGRWRCEPQSWEDTPILKAVYMEPKNSRCAPCRRGAVAGAGAARQRRAAVRGAAWRLFRRGRHHAAGDDRARRRPFPLQDGAVRPRGAARGRGRGRAPHAGRVRRAGARAVQGHEAGHRQLHATAAAALPRLAHFPQLAASIEQVWYEKQHIVGFVFCTRANLAAFQGGRWYSDL